MRLPFLALWSQTKRPTQRFTEVWYLSEKSLWSIVANRSSHFPDTNQYWGKKETLQLAATTWWFWRFHQILGALLFMIENSSIIFQWMGKGLSATIGGESLASPKSFWSQCWGYVANPPWLTQKKTNIKGPTSCWDLVLIHHGPGLQVLIKLSSLELEKK